MSSKEKSVSSELDISMLLTGLSDDQRKLVMERMRSLQTQFAVYNMSQEEQKITDVRSQFPELSRDAVLIALESCRGNEIIAMQRLHLEAGYSQKVVDMANGVIEKNIDSIMVYDRKQEIAEIMRESEESDEDADYVMTRGNKRYCKTLSDSGSSSSNTPSSSNKRRAKEARRPRLLLNDAMSKLLEIQLQKQKSKKSDDADTSDSDLLAHFEQKKTQYSDESTPGSPDKQCHDAVMDGGDLIQCPVPVCQQLDEQLCCESKEPDSLPSSKSEYASCMMQSSVNGPKVDSADPLLDIHVKSEDTSSLHDSATKSRQKRRKHVATHDVDCSNDPTSIRECSSPPTIPNSQKEMSSIAMDMTDNQVSSSDTKCAMLSDPSCATTDSQSCCHTKQLNHSQSRNSMCSALAPSLSPPLYSKPVVSYSNSPRSTDLRRSTRLKCENANRMKEKTGVQTRSRSRIIHEAHALLEENIYWNSSSNPRFTSREKSNMTLFPRSKHEPQDDTENAQCKESTVEGEVKESTMSPHDDDNHSGGSPPHEMIDQTVMTHFHVKEEEQEMGCMHSEQECVEKSLEKCVERTNDVPCESSQNMCNGYSVLEDTNSNSSCGSMYSNGSDGSMGSFAEGDPGDDSKPTIVKCEQSRYQNHRVYINKKKLHALLGVTFDENDRSFNPPIVKGPNAYHGAACGDEKDDVDSERLRHVFSKSTHISKRQLEELGWSRARIQAYKNRHVNPNMYYYRFNDPWEPQKTGPWSKADIKHFMSLIARFGVDYQWGIFSMKIPGRVGYQCSNYYRYLIKEGIIRDENYIKDEEGNLRFLFKTKDGKNVLRRYTNSGKRSRSSKSRGYRESHPFDSSDDSVSYEPRKRGKFRAQESVTMEEEEDEEEEEEEAEEIEDSVLPGYIDPMTMHQVVDPAISPYGHVMGYESWVTILNRNPKNTCPFTKQKLTRRSLVKLTKENIEEYRSKIIRTNGLSTEP